MSDLTDWRIARRRRDTVEVHKTPEEILADINRRLTALEEAPTPLIPANDAAAVPVAIGELHARVDGFANQLDEIGQDLAEMSAVALKHIVILQKRLDACEARFGDLPNVLAQIQAERRRHG